MKVLGYPSKVIKKHALTTMTQKIYLNPKYKKTVRYQISDRFPKNYN